MSGPWAASVRCDARAILLLVAIGRAPCCRAAEKALDLKDLIALFRRCVQWLEAFNATRVHRNCRTHAARDLTTQDAEQYHHDADQPPRRHHRTHALSSLCSVPGAAAGHSFSSDTLAAPTACAPHWLGCR